MDAEELLTVVRCPYDQDEKLEYADNDDGERLLNGTLGCGRCGRSFPVTDGIPNLLPDELRTEAGDGSWDRGARGWRAGFVSRVLAAGSAAKSQAEGELCEKLTRGCNLEIGCGESPLPGCAVYTDVYVPQKPPRCFVLASAEHLPFPPGSFDIVVSRYVIEHLPHTADFLVAAARIARERVIVLTDNCHWIGELWFRLTRTGRTFHDEHCFAWTVEFLSNLIRRLGLTGSVRSCNFSGSYAVAAMTALAWLPRIGVCFHRDIIAEIEPVRTADGDE